MARSRRRMSRVCLFLSLLLPLAAAQAAELVIYAAASLKPVLDEIVATPEAKAVATVTVSYGASSALARQIDQGAPAAVFISADEEWMDWLAQRNHVVGQTRHLVAGNALVLVAPKDSKTTLKIAEGFDLKGALGDGRLALAEPNSVPAGKYAKASLTALKVWDSIADHIVAAENVRAALALAVRGEVPLAAVYRSDAVSEPAVRVVDTFPESSHAPIVYPAAVLDGHDAPEARAFLKLVDSEKSRAAFQRWGFSDAGKH